MVKYWLAEYDKLCNNAWKLFMYTRRHESMVDNLYLIKNIKDKRCWSAIKNINYKDEINKTDMSRCKVSLSIKHDELNALFPNIFIWDDVLTFFSGIEMIRDIIAHWLLGVADREDWFNCFRFLFKKDERNFKLAEFWWLEWDGKSPFIFPITEWFVDEWKDKIFTFRESKKVVLNNVLQINLGDFY